MTPALSPFPSRSLVSGLDPKRIAGTSLALALHAVALGLLLTPVAWEAPAPRAPVVVVPNWIEPEPIIIRNDPPPTPDPVPVETPPRDPQPVPVADPAPVLAESAPIDAGQPPADPGTPAEAGPAEDSGAVGAGDPTTLAYLEAPAPRYPAAAARRGLTGTVLLRVHVDATGLPRAVDIERSSGHRVLDMAAREQVLSRWRFQPALRGGRPVEAIGLVPVAFNLPR